MILVFTKSIQSKTLKCVGKNTFKVCAYSVNPLSFSSKNKATVTVKPVKPILINAKSKASVSVTPASIVSSTAHSKSKATVNIQPFLIDTKTIKIQSKHSDIHLAKNILVSKVIISKSKAKVSISKTCYTSVTLNATSKKSLFILKAKTSQACEVHAKGSCVFSPHSPKISRSTVHIKCSPFVKIQKHNKRYKG